IVPQLCKGSKNWCLPVRQRVVLASLVLCSGNCAHDDCGSVVAELWLREGRLGCGDCDGGSVSALDFERRAMNKKSTGWSLLELLIVVALLLLLIGVAIPK